MPNNTTIEMTVSGPTEVLDLFIASHIVPVPEENQSAWAPEPYHFDFNTIVPRPALYDRNAYGIDGKYGGKYDEEDEEVTKYLEKTYGHGGWYDWCVANWGVKWNSYDNNINTDYGQGWNGEGSIQINFSTAWTIPEKIFLELLELYPELSFDVECLEEGGGFGGRIVYEDGFADESELRYDIEGWREQATKMFDWEFDENGDVI